MVGKYLYFKGVFLLCVMMYGLCIQPLKAQSPISPLLMSLQQCIDYALENNADIQNAQLNIALRRRNTQEIMSKGLPQVSGQMNADYNFQRPSSFLPAEIVGGTPGTFVAIQFSPAYASRMMVNLEQMIFSASYFVGLKAAETYVNFSKKERDKMRIDLIERVSKAYYLVLVSVAREELIQKNYERIDSLLHDTQIMYENGFVEQIDVDRVRIQHNNTNATKENFLRNLAVGYALLKFEMGMDINTPLTLTDRIQNITLDGDNTAENPYFDYENRIEYTIQKSNIKLLKLSIKNNRAKYLPELDFYGNYGGNAGTVNFSKLFQFNETWRSFGTIGLRLKIPIFDGLSKTRLLQKQQIEMEQLENQKNRLEGSIDLEISRAKMTWLQNMETLNAQKKNMELAKNIYRTTRLKYEAGIGSNTDVIDADVQLKEVQNNYYTALYDALITRVDLDKAYGKLETKLPE